MANQNRCETCDYSKLIGNREKGHCYMFRDGAHIKHDSAALNLPAFVVIGERTQRIEPSKAA